MSKDRIKVSDIEKKKNKVSDKPKKKLDNKPKRKRGRPFGAKTKHRSGLDSDGLESLPEATQKILSMLESQDDSLVVLTQKLMFEKVLMLLPEVEERYYEAPTQQNVYAFNAVVTQLRELIADFQAKQDNSKVLDNILYTVLQPTLLSFVQFLMDSNHNLNKQLKELVKESKHKKLKDIIDNTTKSMGAYGQEMFATLKERLPSALD